MWHTKHKLMKHENIKRKLKWKKQLLWKEKERNLICLESFFQLLILEVSEANCAK